MARIHVLLCACIVLVLLATPCTAVRSLRGDQGGTLFSFFFGFCRGGEVVVLVSRLDGVWFGTLWLENMGAFEV